MKLNVFNSPAFYEAVNKLSTANVSPKLAYKIKKISETIGQESKKFDDIRKSIAEKYGEKDAEGKLVVKNGMVRFPKESLDKAEEELKQLSEIEFDLPVKIKLDELDSGVKMTAIELSLLDDVIEFPA